MCLVICLVILICILIFPFFVQQNQYYKKLFDWDGCKHWQIFKVAYRKHTLKFLQTFHNYHQQNMAALPLSSACEGHKNVLLCGIFTDYLDKVEWIKCLRWCLQSYKTWCFNKVKLKNSDIMIFQIVNINIIFFTVIINIIIYDAFIMKVIKKNILPLRFLGHTLVLQFPCLLTSIMWNFVDPFILYSLGLLSVFLLCIFDQ